MASQVHCRQRADSAIASCLGVGDLVLDVALVALFGGHRLQAMAGLLDLARVGHDGEELRLRLGQDLARADLVEVLALQVGVDGVGGAATLGHGLHDGRRAGAHVAGAEDARAPRRERDRVGRQAPAIAGAHALGATRQPRQLGTLADGQQHPVALDDELGAGHGLRPPSPGCVRRPERHALELHAGDLAAASVTTRVGAAWKMARAPSSSISWTSLAAGMSFMSRRYTRVTSAAPWRTEVREQSIEVKPPPMTTTRVPSWPG